MIRLALNPDTTPLSISDTLVFKSTAQRVREAAEAGFAAVNVDEEEGLTAEDARRILQEYRMEVASGFFHGAFYLPGEEARIYDAAKAKAEFAQALGQRFLFVSALVSPPERRAIAGRVRPDEPISLDDRQFDRMARLLERIARLWRDYDVELCYHPHAATYVEAPHEIERLMETTDASLVRLGPDTGHLLYGGADPIALVARYFSRVGAIHLKDARQAVLDRVRLEKLNYREACARGVWTELGTGDVDFAALFELLRQKAWSGWVIVETDHTQLGTALESSRVSRKYLRDTYDL
jgi:inosose dehydratase